MRDSLVRGVIAILLALQLLLPITSFGQEVRPRRSQSAQPATASAGTEPWKAPATTTVSATPLPPGTAEPLIRVALATDARSATISTAGHLMNASDLANTLVALDVTRVRVEPRMLSPLPAIDNQEMFRLQVAGLLSRDEAEQKSREARKAIGESSQITY